MKIANAKNLPEALVRAVSNDSYSKGQSDYSVTGLLKPARVSALEERHKHELEDDVADRLWALLGQAVHVILERSNKNDLAEKRFFADFEVNGKKLTVSAQIDSLDLVGGVLTDWKLTTAWKFKGNQPPPPEYVAQLNMQLELLRRNGHDAKVLQIVGLLRDFNLRESRSNPDYPTQSCVTMPIPMWSREQTVAFITMRLAAHEDAKRELPECSVDERWAKPDTWAVIKRGQKRAINGGVQFSEEGAQRVCDQNKGTFVQYRKGESTRCGSYCAVNKFCSQFKRLAGASQTDDNQEEIA